MNSSLKSNDAIQELVKKALPKGFTSPAVHNDWDSIYTLSQKTLVQHARLWKLFQEMRCSVAFFLKDLRTIHMGSGRQNGKTTWALEKMRESVGTIVIARDKHMRDAMIGRAAIGKQTGKAITISVDATDPDPMGTVNMLMQAYLAANGARIYTYKDLQSMVEADPSFIKTVERVIIDEAKHNRMLSSIYDLLGTSGNPEIEVIALA